MSAAEIRHHLCALRLERLEAESSGLVYNRAYMADLESEQADYQHALVAAALEEALRLRTALSWRRPRGDSFRYRGCFATCIRANMAQAASFLGAAGADDE
jgi:hypothetical protein